MKLALLFLPLLIRAEDPRKYFVVVSNKLGDPTDPSSSARGTPGRMEWRNTTLANLICGAYSLNEYQLEGGPKWMNSERFHVDAKLPSGAPRTETQLMMRTMLADRFHLEFHRITKTHSVYNLVVANGGPKLPPAAGDDMQRSRSSQGPRQIKGYGLPVSSLAQMLIGAVGAPVVDRTGLEGKYTFVLEFAPMDAREDETLPSIFTVLQEKLGLRLESGKAPIEVLVVDRAEKPSEN
jgi:uncharacterized protein (TIGR03435 family)